MWYRCTSVADLINGSVLHAVHFTFYQDPCRGFFVVLGL